MAPYTAERHKHTAPSAMHGFCAPAPGIAARGAAGSSRRCSKLSARSAPFAAAPALAARTRPVRLAARAARAEIAPQGSKPERPSVVASAATLDAPSVRTAPDASPAESGAFDWHNKWYPIAFLKCASYLGVWNLIFYMLS